MRLIFFLSFLIIGGQSFSQNHELLRSRGMLSLALFGTAKSITLYELKQQAMPGEAIKGDKKKIIVETAEFCNEIIMSGRLMINDSLSSYANQVLDQLLKDDQVLRKKLKVYFYYSAGTNAITLSNGMIIIELGLMAHVKNEAQLAFILAHEITHYRQGHMLKGYLNREELKEKSSTTPQYLLLSSYYSYNQDQELEADKMGFELYKKSPYSVREALRSFDVLDYSDLPFDDVPFDTTFFNKDYMTIPAGYFMKDVDPIYSDDNYEDRNSTHPNVRKRRMALMTEVDTVKNAGTHLYAVSKDEFLSVRETARYEICRLYLIERNYPGAIYACLLYTSPSPRD